MKLGPRKWIPILSMALGFPATVFLVASATSKLVDMGYLGEIRAQIVFFLLIIFPLVGMVFYAIKIGRR